MKASDLYAQGRLEEAIGAMNEEVRAAPQDVGKRGFLVELLCIAGNLERADTLLEQIGKQDPKAMMGVALQRQLVRAEQARQQFHSEGRLPEFLGSPSADLQLHLRASIALREGREDEALALLEESEARRPRLSGTHDGAVFDDLRDLDDLTSRVLEVLTSTGKYYWIPLENVDRIEPRALERPSDLLWRRVLLEVRGGPEGEVYLPAVYAPTKGSSEAELLARSTEWRGGEGAPIRGRGQRTFLIGEEAVPLLQLGEVVFETAAPGS